MSGRDLAVWILLSLGGLTVLLSAVGLLAAPTLLARLHFLTPITSVAAPLIGVAYLVDQGIGLSAGLVLLIVGLLAVTGPPLGSAMGRLVAAEEGLVETESSS